MLLLIATGVGCSHAPLQTQAAHERHELVTHLTTHPVEVAGGVPPSNSPGPPAPPELLSGVDPATTRPIDDAPSNQAKPMAPPVSRSPMSEFPIEMNTRVKLALKYLQTHRSAAIAQAFWRARRYAGMMRTIFREYDLPEELVNLAFIESEVNPRATSPAMAAGIWQFVPATARFYGMRTTAAVDERRDPEKSTRAAAEHLRSLYQRFQAWPLALAAYNAGSATVQRAIDRQRTRDFWKLRLPNETRRFVPKFMAMTIISRDPKRYGFSPPPDDPHDTETLHVRQPTAIRDIAAAAGTTVKHLQELNPELVGPATPSDRSGYTLRIPRRFTWISHKVREGETLATIARRYKVSPHMLREANMLGTNGEPKVGRVLLVPAKPQPPPA